MKFIRKVFLTLIVIICITLIFGVNTNAVDFTKTKGSLTIIKYEKGLLGHEGENIPLKDVEFTIYKVPDDWVDKTTPDDSMIPTAKDKTGENGKVIFQDLDIGRYLVIETKVPENVTERIENFLVDIPRTTENGEDVIYDITVEPKNNSAYGSITLTKEGIDSAKLKAVTFVLQKKIEEKWEDYPDSTKAVLSTNENGQITVENLPMGNYRFVETSLGSNKEYILDNETGHEFNVSINTTDFKTVVTPESITIVNDKPGITKEIDHITKNTTNNVEDEKNSTDIGNTITYKTETDIPNTIARLNTYKITDTMDKGLELNTESITVKAGESVLSNKTDYTVIQLEENNGFVLEIKDTGKTKLDTAYKAGNKKMQILYDILLTQEADATNVGNKNKARLSYSNIVNENYKGESNNPDDPANIITTKEVETVIYTGGLLIEKRENSKSGKTLSGAVFKIASTKEDAKKRGRNKALRFIK